VHAATTVALTPTSVLVPTSGAPRFDHRRPYTVPTISHTNAAAKPTPFHGCGNANRRATAVISGSIHFLYRNSGVLASHLPPTPRKQAKWEQQQDREEQDLPVRGEVDDRCHHHPATRMTSVIGSTFTRIEKSVWVRG
jgi:hypothetical protein